jgi:hypothetical protein
MLAVIEGGSLKVAGRWSKVKTEGFSSMMLIMVCELPVLFRIVAIPTMSIDTQPKRL